ncbi:MAG: hypothetical protein U0746_17335 [Gemmataceae bacterium]
MAEMTIRLRCDPATGKRDIIVSLDGEEDMTPHEHETLHRKLVEKLVDGGLLQAGEAGALVIEREEHKGEAVQTPVDQPLPQKQSVEQGQ